MMMIRVYQIKGRMFLIIVRISRIIFFPSVSDENQYDASLGPLISNSKISMGGRQEPRTTCISNFRLLAAMYFVTTSEETRKIFRVQRNLKTL
jgi:hypothetical protein